MEKGREPETEPLRRAQKGRRVCWQRRKELGVGAAGPVSELGDASSFGNV